MAEYQIGATELRQKLTDVIQTIREENATYVVETFGRPQVVIMGLEEYGRFRELRAAREAFFDWLSKAGEVNAALNLDLSDDDLLAIIDEARAAALTGKP